MRRREPDRSCSLKKWQLKLRSRRWRKRSYCWRTKIPNFWRWDQYAWWRFCTQVIVVPSDSSQNVWDCSYAVTLSIEFAPEDLWGLNRLKLRHIELLLNWPLKGRYLPCILSNFMSLPNLRAGSSVDHSYRCSLRTDFQKCTASAVLKPGLLCVKLQVWLSWKTNVHVSILLQLILNIDRSVTWNKICIIYAVWDLCMDFVYSVICAA